MNKKSLTISECIKQLEVFKEKLGDVEIFTTQYDESGIESVCFYGITSMVGLQSPNDGQVYLSLIANGDILK